MLSQEVIEKILGITEKVPTSPEVMADHLNVTFMPTEDNGSASPAVLNYTNLLKQTFLELKVNIVPYEEAFTTIPLKSIAKRFLRMTINNVCVVLNHIYPFFSDRFFIDLSEGKRHLKRKRLKKGIAVIVSGEQSLGNLPMEYISNFKDNSVISILDLPQHINTDTPFETHFSTAMDMFAYHMTNIVIAVDLQKWVLYNFNASHPFFKISERFKEDVLKALIPKIVAPISPLKFSDFFLESNFEITGEAYKNAIVDLVRGSKKFANTNLYPKGKKIDELPFRSNFHKWIGKLHLDGRNGMSYGFLARQMSLSIDKLIPLQQVLDDFNTRVEDKEYFYHNNHLYIRIILKDGDFFYRIPDVFILSQRSGSDKTNFNPEKDLIRIGLRDGEMLIAFPNGTRLDSSFKPSFDTRIMLAHAVANTIIAAILKHYDPMHQFVRQLEEEGMALAHWHGYINMEFLPHGWHIHGDNNPHVACSTPQSAIYALDGKIKVFMKALQEGGDFYGDVHIEPHHGTNMTYPSVVDLADFFLNHKAATVLGNKYLPK